MKESGMMFHYWVTTSVAAILLISSVHTAPNDVLHKRELAESESALTHSGHSGETPAFHQNHINDAHEHPLHKRSGSKGTGTGGGGVIDDEESLSSGETPPPVVTSYSPNIDTGESGEKDSSQSSSTHPSATATTPTKCPTIQDFVQGSENFWLSLKRAAGWTAGLAVVKSAAAKSVDALAQCLQTVGSGIIPYFQVPPPPPPEQVGGEILLLANPPPMFKAGNDDEAVLLPPPPPPILLVEMVPVPPVPSTTLGGKSSYKGSTSTGQETSGVGSLAEKEKSKYKESETRISLENNNLGDPSKVTGVTVSKSVFTTSVDSKYDELADDTVETVEKEKLSEKSEDIPIMPNEPPSLLAGGIQSGGGGESDDTTAPKSDLATMAQLFKLLSGSDAIRKLASSSPPAPPPSEMDSGSAGSKIQIPISVASSMALSNSPVSYTNDESSININKGNKVQNVNVFGDMINVSPKKVVNPIRIGAVKTKGVNPDTTIQSRPVVVEKSGKDMEPKKVKDDGAGAGTNGKDETEQRWSRQVVGTPRPKATNKPPKSAKSRR